MNIFNRWWLRLPPAQTQNQHGWPKRVPSGLYPCAYLTLAGTSPHSLGLLWTPTFMRWEDDSADKSPSKSLSFTRMLVSVALRFLSNRAVQQEMHDHCRLVQWLWTHFRKQNRLHGHWDVWSLFAQRSVIEVESSNVLKWKRSVPSQTNACQYVRCGCSKNMSDSLMWTSVQCSVYRITAEHSVLELTLTDTWKSPAQFQWGHSHPAPVLGGQAFHPIPQGWHQSAGCMAHHNDCWISEEPSVESLQLINKAILNRTESFLAPNANTLLQCSSFNRVMNNAAYCWLSGLNWYQAFKIFDKTYFQISTHPVHPELHFLQRLDVLEKPWNSAGQLQKNQSSFLHWLKFIAPTFLISM